MQFVLTDEYCYWWPVRVDIPDPEKPGKLLQQSFEASFIALPSEEAEAVDAEFRSFRSAEQRVAGEQHLLTRVIKGWRGVTAAGGGEAPFSPETLAQALRYPFFRAGCYRAYAQSLSGVEARLGN